MAEYINAALSTSPPTASPYVIMQPSQKCHENKTEKMRDSDSSKDWAKSLSSFLDGREPEEL